MPSAQTWTTVSPCDAAAQHYKARNNNQLSKALEPDPSTLTLWRKGARVMSDPMGARCADLLGIDAGHVLACLALERVSDAKLSEKLRAFIESNATRAASVFAVFSACLVVAEGARFFV